MHVTHPKAGSTWITTVMRELFGDHIAPRGPLVAEATGGDVSKHCFAPGRVYPAQFMTREEFLAHPELRDIKRFVVIRDLRDTLVSLYFSIKFSPHRKKPEVRAVLETVSEEEGLLFLIHNDIDWIAAIQRSWLNQGEVVLRYEDLFQRAEEILSETFIEKFGIPIDPKQMSRAVERSRFERMFKRKPGEEDIRSHGRQGLPGDWRNHFGEKVRRDFLERFGSVLVAAGYEADDSWATGDGPARG